MDAICLAFMLGVTWDGHNNLRGSYNGETSNKIIAAINAGGAIAAAVPEQCTQNAGAVASHRINSDTVQTALNHITAACCSRVVEDCGASLQVIAAAPSKTG